MTKRTVDAKDPVKKVDGVSSNQAAGMIAMTKRMIAMTNERKGVSDSQGNGQCSWPSGNPTEWR